jgi:hypothetical protein
MKPPAPDTAMTRLLSAALPTALAALGVLGGGCALAKEARLGLEESVQPRYVERISSEVGGPVEIHCGIGEACVEVKVVHVQRDLEGGVEVTLQNRTENAVAVQLAFEGFDDKRRRTDKSGFHDVVLGPRGQQVLALATAVESDDVLVVHLRPRVGA